MLWLKLISISKRRPGTIFITHRLIACNVRWPRWKTLIYYTKMHNIISYEYCSDNYFSLAIGAIGRRYISVPDITLNETVIWQAYLKGTCHTSNDKIRFRYRISARMHTAVFAYTYFHCSIDIKTIKNMSSLSHLIWIDIFIFRFRWLKYRCQPYGRPALEIGLSGKNHPKSNMLSSKLVLLENYLVRTDSMSTLDQFIICISLFSITVHANTGSYHIPTWSITGRSAREFWMSQNISAEIWILFNTLRPSQNGHRFTNDIFNFIFLCASSCFPTPKSAECLAKGPSNTNPALVQRLAWCQACYMPFIGLWNG